MKVLQTIAGMGRLAGGPSTCTADLLRGLDRIAPNSVDLLTVKDISDVNLGHGEGWLREVERDYLTPLAISRNLRRVLKNGHYDLYHTNGLWMDVNHATCALARAKGLPYVISTHGMLYETALRISRWKKLPLLWTWYNKDIFGANALHATCLEEMRQNRRFGYRGPIAVIPNPIVIPDYVKPKTMLTAERKIGFIGRLHPIKNVDKLIRAVRIAIDSGIDNFTLEIMGSGNEGYELFLRREVARFGLNDYVRFVGFVNGTEKYKRLSEIRALFVPSAQENFGMIVPEALICGTPVYASTGTPWGELVEHDCGWWRDSSPETIAEVIAKVMAADDNRLLAMGLRGRQLIEEVYEQGKVAQKMLHLYEWILNKGDKPDFVYVD